MNYPFLVFENTGLSDLRKKLQINIWNIKVILNYNKKDR